MFYQNNNDYMRDAFYYSVPQNATYQNGCWNNPMVGNTMQPQMFQNPMLANPSQQPMQLSASSMYPQIYRIINPVANRVISNSNYQFLTEEVLNNLVDTVFNIVEGDISYLSNRVGDDTVMQVNSRNQTNNNNSNTTLSAGNTRTITTNESRASNNINLENNKADSQLIKDLIKIIIIKEILSRQNGFNRVSNQNFYDPRLYGII